MLQQSGIPTGIRMVLGKRGLSLAVGAERPWKNVDIAPDKP
jgi:hypothetical protein